MLTFYCITPSKARALRNRVARYAANRSRTFVLWFSSLEFRWVLGLGFQNQFLDDLMEEECQARFVDPPPSRSSGPSNIETKVQGIGGVVLQTHGSELSQIGHGRYGRTSTIIESKSSSRGKSRRGFQLDFQLRARFFADF